MKEKKFFDKFIENITRLDENNIKSFLEYLDYERRTFQQILDHLDEGIIFIEGEKIIFLNNEAKILLGIFQIKLPIFINEMVNIVINKELLDIILSTLDKKDYQQECCSNLKNKKYYSIEKIYIKDNYYIYKIKDITDNKNLQLKLKQFESISALNNLAAGIAHEVKNPLTAIDLHTQIILKAIEKKIIEVPEEVFKYINIISEEVNRLNKILNDFLLAARKRELELSFEDINEYIKELIDFFMPEFDKYSINLKTNFNPIPKIFIDKDYLKQALINLIKNAIDAIQAKDYSKDMIDIKNIEITTFYDNGIDAVGIVIKDNGCGIKMENMPKIFEPYYTTKENGTGLGLTIVYKIIKEHNGEIKVESKENEGTSFTIYLPVSQGRKMISNK